MYKISVTAEEYSSKGEVEDCQVSRVRGEELRKVSGIDGGWKEGVGIKLPRGNLEGQDVLFSPSFQGSLQPLLLVLY